MGRLSIDPAARASVSKQGWQSFDTKSAPYTADQIRKERELYR